MNTPFHLDQAIARWRAELSDSGAIGGTDLNELEAHLRDSFEGLRAPALSEEEAFLIARRRLGGAEVVEEFAKANPEAVWADRGRWMILGILGSLIFWGGAKIAMSFALLAVAKSTHGVGWSGAAMAWSEGAVAVLAVGLFALILIRLVRGRWCMGGSKWSAFFLHPAVLATLACLLIPLQTLSTALGTRFLGLHAFAEVMRVQQYAVWAMALITPIILVAALSMARCRLRRIS